jgi:hypothetical protein
MKLSNIEERKMLLEKICNLEKQLENSKSEREKKVENDFLNLRRGIIFCLFYYYCYFCLFLIRKNDEYFKC